MIARAIGGSTARRKARAAARPWAGELSQALLDSLTSITAVLRPDGVIVAVNEAWRRFARANGAAVPVVEGVGLDYLDACRRASASGSPPAGEALAGIEGVLDGKSESFTVEYACDSPMEKRWFLLSARPLSGATGGAVLSHVDVTERRRDQESARALIHIGKELAGTLDLTQTAERVVSTVLGLFRARRANLYRLDPESGALTCIASAGDGDPAAWRGRVLSRGQGLVGRAVEERRMVCSLDLLAEPGVTLPDWLAARVRGGDFRALVALPLGAGAEIVGALVLGDAQGRTFAEPELRLLSAFADQAALALHNARLFDQTQQRLRETETLLRVSQTVGSTLDVTETMRRVARETARALGADMVGAYLADGDQRCLRAIAGYHVPKHLLERFQSFAIPLKGHRLVEEAWARQRPVFSSDVPADPRLDPETMQQFPVRSILFFPMIVNWEPVGGLIVCWWEEAHQFTGGELGLVDGISRQAALAIENARLYREVCQQAERTEGLADVGRLVSETLDPDVVAQRVADSIRQLLGAQQSVLYRLDPDSQDLVSLAVSGDGVAALGEPIVLARGTGVAGLALRERGPVVSLNQLDDPRLTFTAEMRQGIEQVARGSVLAVPLRIQDRVIGALSVKDRPGRTFSDDDVRLVTGFADRAAMAMANARLFEESERRRRAAESLAELGRLVSQSLESDVVGQRIVESVRALFGAPMSAIYLLERPTEDLTLFAATAGPGCSMDWCRRVPRDTGMSGLALQHRRPVSTPDVLREERVTLTPDDRGRIERSAYRAVLAVPLAVGDAAIGALVIGGQAGRRFDDEEIRLAQSFADQAALAIEHTRLYGEIRTARDFLQSVAENSPDAIITADIEGRLTYFSPGAEEMSGYGVEEVRGRALGDLFAQGLGEARAIMRRLRSEERIRDYETRLLAKDGRAVEVQCSLSLLRDASGAIVGTMGILKDATERRQLEEQFRQSQKMEAVGRLAGGIAHDFNNLLTVITGRSQLMLERLRPEEPLHRDAKLVRTTADRAAALTRQLLAFSRKQVMQPQVLDLNSVVSGMAPMLHRLIGEDIELAVAPGPDLGRIKADPGQLEQVIVNLAVNARDAMPRGGRLLIETANTELDAAYAARHVGTEPGRYVLLAVSDTGIGMDEQTRSQVFEPFFTTKEPGKGTGLGLSTVYGIVKQSGGTISVYSEPGQGATFKIYLPYIEESAAPVETRAAAADAVRGVETVLITEDEPDVRGLARDILEACGYTVLEARDADEALLIAERHAGPIQLLLTDVVMPRMSGRALAERLGPLRPEMSVLYMSGYTDAAIVHHGVLEPGTAFVQKPFTPEGLASKVREVLDRSRRLA